MEKQEKTISKIPTKTLIQKIQQGKIFIYPTDTIYGLGCDAENKKAVSKIKSIKSRDKDKPISIIAPSIKWIKENCQIPSTMKLNKYLPGPYTLILKKQNPKFLTHISKTETIGIRIPKNPLTKQIQKSEKPFITTSVNLAGQPPIININEIPKKIEKQVDIIINQGPLTGKPSTLIIEGKEVRR
ncbi:threonylcarbamoyl-AMP synthase [archaeon]|mgnify:CR=1 FL=1|jgi:L-threonylcarbamoyladenylate synthase|nr:threonylcarbamoyl-AMP synthase [archaeon]MBT4241631.1 threonylcarbamoyl-AMP synthase [archaeon]MBT4418026.1 threonylcarbamoyl-AMP synthase [archaeon]